MQIAWHVNVQISSRTSMKVRPEKFHRNVIFSRVSMIVFTWGRGCCSNKKGAWKAPWVKCRKWFWRNFLACKRNHNESFESLSKTSLHLQPNFTWCYSQVLYTQYDHHRHLQTFLERSLAHANQQNAQHHVNIQSPLSLKPNAEKN